MQIIMYLSSAFKEPNTLLFLTEMHLTLFTLGADLFTVDMCKYQVWTGATLKCKYCTTEKKLKDLVQQYEKHQAMYIMNVTQKS